MAVRTDLFGLLISEVTVEDDFNCRYDYGDLQELADSIVERGIIVPIQVYQKKNILTFFLMDGHRRLRAVQLAISQGKLDPLTFRFPAVKIRPLSDVDRALSLVTYNSGKQLHMLEEAIPYDRAIKYGARVEEIAKRVSKSTAHIDNCLRLLTASIKTKELIKAGRVSPTLVYTKLRKMEPAELENELLEAIKNKEQSLATENINKSGSVDDDIFIHEDNVKTSGVSGMNIPAESGKPVKITARNLEKGPKVNKYTKEQILNMISSGYDEASGLSLYEFLNNTLN